MMESIIIALDANQQVVESIPKSHYKKREAADKSGHLYRALVVHLVGEHVCGNWNLLQEWDGRSLIFECEDSLLNERRRDFEVANEPFYIEEGVLGCRNIIRVGAL